MIDKLATKLEPPAKVMDRAKASKQIALVEAVDSKLDEARTELLAARAALAIKDSTDHRDDLAVARDTVDLLLDKRLEAMA